MLPLTCTCQLEWLLRLTQARDGSVPLVAIRGLCPEISRRAIDHHRLIADNGCRPAVKLDDVKFSTATRVPNAYLAEVRSISRVNQAQVARESRANISL